MKRVFVVFIFIMSFSRADKINAQVSAKPLIIAAPSNKYENDEGYCLVQSIFKTTQT